MATLSNVAQVIRRVRQRLGLSQGALARRLNATVGAIQHWERGRNNPGLARLLALQQLCPRSPEWTQLGVLIRHAQVGVAPLGVGSPARGVRKARKALSPPGASIVLPIGEVELLRREHDRLRRQVAKLDGLLEKRDEQLRILQNRTTDLQRESITLRANQSGDPTSRNLRQSK